MACVSDSTSIHTYLNPDGSLGASLIVDPDANNLLTVGAAGAKVLPSGFGLTVGTIVETGGATVSAGYVAADGSAISRTTYANLFAVYGTRYGSGDGVTTFNVPNVRFPGNFVRAEQAASVGLAVSANEAGATVVITCPSLSIDGVTPIEFEFFAASLRGDNNDATTLISLQQDAVGIGLLSQNHVSPNIVQQDMPLGVYKYLATPAAGSHIYRVVGWTSAGTRTLLGGAAGAGLSVPIYLKCTAQLPGMIKT